MRMIERLIEPQNAEEYDIDGSNIAEYGFFYDQIEWWWIYGWAWPKMNLRGSIYTLMYLTGYNRYVPWARLW